MAWSWGAGRPCGVARDGSVKVHAFAPSSATGFTLMAVDAGSNALKYRAWRVGRSRGEVVELDAGRVPLRLGEGLTEGSDLGPEMIERCVEAFGRVAERASELGVERVRAVGTNALRSVSNGAQVVEEIRKASGIGLEIIEAGCEARLVAKALQRLDAPPSFPYLVLDVGGGSSEIIRAETRDRVQWGSLPLGAVNLRDPFFSELPTDQAHLRSARAHIDEMIGRHLADPPRGGCGEGCFGSGGTPTVVQSMMEDAGEVEGEMRIVELLGLIQQMETMSVEQLAEQFGLPRERAEIILPGALVLERLARHVGAERIRAVHAGVTMGLLQEAMESAGMA